MRAQNPPPLDQGITVGCSAGVVNLPALPATLTREVSFHILPSGCHVDMVILIKEYSDSSYNCRSPHLETVIYSECYIL